MDYTKTFKKIKNLHARVPYKFFNGHAFFPLNVLFELTYRCNLRCKMCQFLPLVKESTNIIKQSPELELSSDQIKSTIEQIPKNTLITFTGGEPFMRKDIMDIISFGTKKHKCHLITNATLLKKANIEGLVKLASKNLISSGLLMIEISLEGTKNIHDSITSVNGSFEKTTENIRLITRTKKKYNLKYPLINIAAVITNENINILPELVSLSKNLGADIISFLTYSNFPHFERFKERVLLREESETKIEKNIDSELLTNQIEKVKVIGKEVGIQVRFSPHGLKMNQIINYYSKESNDSNDSLFCSSPWSMTIISSCGDVMPCSNYISGNIKDGNLLKIWNGKKFKLFRNNLKDKRLFSGCHGCCMVETK